MICTLATPFFVGLGDTMVLKLIKFFIGILFLFNINKKLKTYPNNKLYNAI